MVQFPHSVSKTFGKKLMVREGSVKSCIFYGVARHSIVLISSNFHTLRVAGFDHLWNEGVLVGRLYH